MEASRYGAGMEPPSRGAAGRSQTRSTETKQAFKTTEFFVYVVILIGLLIAGLVADADDETGVDGFGANKVWLYAVILTVGYMLSRGLAKSGSRDPYSEHARSSGEGGGIGDRMKAAAQVMREGEGTGTHGTRETGSREQY